MCKSYVQWWKKPILKGEIEKIEGETQSLEWGLKVTILKKCHSPVNKGGHPYSKSKLPILVDTIPVLNLADL